MKEGKARTWLPLNKKNRIPFSGCTNNFENNFVASPVCPNARLTLVYLHSTVQTIFFEPCCHRRRRRRRLFSNGGCRTTFFRDKGNELLSRTFFTILFFVLRKNRAIKTSQSRSTFSVPPPLSPPITRSRKKKSGVYFLKPSAHTKMRESRCCRSSH